MWKRSAVKREYVYTYMIYDIDIWYNIKYISVDICAYLKVWFHAFETTLTKATIDWLRIELKQ